MLDAETQTGVTQPAGALQGQRILVLGACCGFGRGMVRALNAASAKVIAADSNTDALKLMSGVVPLALRGEADMALRRVGRQWGSARLDAVLNLMPLRRPELIDLNIAVLQGAVQGFMPSLIPQGGQILTVVARPDQPLELGAGAMAPALLSAQNALAQTLKRDGLLLNMISVGEGGVKPARSAAIGLLGKSLGPLTGAELRV
ncbi:MAG: hypothetical protein ABJJ53_17635 [Sulfitobacter sp.]